MIFIIGFIVLVIVLFRHFYYVNTLEQCRNNTEDGIVFTDCFGHTRLLRNNRLVTYMKKDRLGTRLCYLNGTPVDVEASLKESANFFGNEYYFVFKKNQINMFKLVDTEEIYAIAQFNNHYYFVDYPDNGPMKILKETNRSINDHNINLKFKGINIDEMNIVLENMYNQRQLVTYDYFNYAMCKYMALKRLKYSDMLINFNGNYKQPIIITKENVNTLVPDFNARWKGHKL